MIEPSDRRRRQVPGGGANTWLRAVTGFVANLSNELPMNSINLDADELEDIRYFLICFKSGSNVKGIL